MESGTFRGIASPQRPGKEVVRVEEIGYSQVSPHYQLLREKTIMTTNTSSQIESGTFRGIASPQRPGKEGSTSRGDRV